MAEDVHLTKAGSLIDKVWHLPNLRPAWTLVKANHGTWGVDRQSLEAFEANLDDELLDIQAALKDDAYVPLPGRRVYIPKPDGRRRGLAVPAVRDRVVQTALRLRLEPHFEARGLRRPVTGIVRAGQHIRPLATSWRVSTAGASGSWRWTLSTSSLPRPMSG